MKYVNYFEKLHINSIILNDKKYNHIRDLFRLYKAVGRYINAAIMQYNRIEEWAILQKRLGTRTISGNNYLGNEQIFSDIHFMLIAMDKCYKYEAELYNKLSFDSSSAECQNLKANANNIRIMRNTLEHSEENLSNTSQNRAYDIPLEYTDNNWSWLEYQLLTLKNGVVTIRDKKLVFSETMFDNILYHYDIIINAIKKIMNTFPI